MRREHDRSRPGEKAASNVIAAGDDKTIVAPTGLAHPKAIAPAYAVFTFHDDGMLKQRRLYLSLHSAVRAQERAEAKGHRFELMLVELVPVTAKPVLVVQGGAA